jgi:hypothetical protein
MAPFFDLEKFVEKFEDRKFFSPLSALNAGPPYETSFTDHTDSIHGAPKLTALFFLSHQNALFRPTIPIYGMLSNSSHSRTQTVPRPRWLPCV